MAAPTMTALVASIRLHGAWDIEHMECIHCDCVVAFLTPGDLLTKSMGEVRKHAAVCPKWPERRRLVKAVAVVPGQLTIQLPDSE